MTPPGAASGRQHRLTQLDSGIRIVTETMSSVRSVSLGFWVGSGSRAEAPDEAGLTHLLEHLLFKGGARYGSLEIDRIFDAMGAEINAGTGRETTSVYSRVSDERLERALDVIADIVFTPALRDADSEREVVLEELAMYEDDPQDKVFDLFAEAVFGGDHPLGRSTLGRPEVVSGTPVDEIRAFHADRYTTANTVIAAAGAVDHEALVDLVRGRAPSAGAVPASVEPAPAAAAPRVRFERKDTEQFHVCIGGPGIALGDERRFALRVLDTVLGGVTSSRLFQEVRELRGLAYSVHSFAGQYADSGHVGIYLGTRADNLPPALEVVAGELSRLLAEPVPADELQRAKDNLKGRMMLSLESTGARMERLGSALLAGMPLLGVDEVAERIEAVSAADISALAGELLVPERLSVAAIGPDGDVLRAALRPLRTAAEAAA